VADFSYQALMGVPVQQPQSLWNGIAQAPQVPNNLSPLEMMFAKQWAQQDPRNPPPMREINPGATWGGRDPNAVQPYDVQMSRTYVQPPENI